MGRGVKRPQEVQMKGKKVRPLQSLELKKQSNSLGNVA